VTQQRWKQIRDTFDSALDKPIADRNEYLIETCGADEGLKNEVLSLLRSFEEHADFLEQPVAPLAFSEKPVDRMEGRRLGPYLLTRCIGKGGMGAVYAASRADKEYQKEVAIKLVRQGMDTEDILRRFRQERQVLAQLDHPNIARLLDGGTTEEGLPYLVMEFVEGVTLDRYAESKKLTINERLELFCTVCGAVQFAHQRLIVHRDLKPGNILIAPDGTPKLLDFGIAKLMQPEFDAELTRTDVRPMTPEFASPEQVRGEPITTSSDVYSLGVILYRLITGCTPYRSKTTTILDIEKAILNESPERPSVAVTRMDGKQPPEGVERASRQLSGDLDMIVLMALRKEPGRRYASAEKLADDIQRYLNGMPVSAQSDTVRYRVGKFVRRHKGAVAAGALTAVALVTATIVSAAYARVANIESARARTRFKEVQSLAEFFLFDLDKAISAGPTAARKKVVDQGLIYLNRLAPDAAGDLSLQRTLVRGYMKVGDLQGNLIKPNVGDAAAARDTYQRAIALAQAVSGAANHDVDSQLALAEAHAKLGEMLSIERNNGDALRHFKNAQTLYEPLVANNAHAKKGLSDVLSRVGTVQEQKGDVEAARVSFESYLKLADGLVAAGDHSVGMRLHRAVAFLKLGRLLARTGEKAKALENLQRARKEFSALAKGEPERVPPQRDLASADNILGDVLVTNKQSAQAVEYFRNALQITEQLALKDPQNQQNQRDLAATLGRLSAALYETGSRLEARQAVLRAFAVLKPMVDKPTPHSYDLYQYCWRLLTTEFKDLRNPRVALQIAENLVARTKGESPEMLDLLARAQSANGKPLLAVQTEEKALAALPKSAASDLRLELETNLSAFRAQAPRQ
jgi:tetratricopeptide (TPR) repeat protein/tRNA A-37 threonylcarbamoyl transferase component Bud32